MHVMERILVVDDDANIRSSVAAALDHGGYTVATAANGRQAIAIHLEAPVDLIIIDIFMPEKDGLETIMELRQGFPDMKIIAMSGRGATASKDYLEAAKAFGADAALSKPFSYSYLRRTILGLGGICR